MERKDVTFHCEVCDIDYRIREIDKHVHIMTPSYLAFIEDCVKYDAEKADN